MNKPHLFKHDGVWIIRKEVDPEKNGCKGCIGRGDGPKCEALPECSVSADNEYGRIYYIFKEIPK